MAGGKTNMAKFDPKQVNLYKQSQEILKDSQSAPEKKFSLSGILGLNQTIEINSQEPDQTPKINWSQEFLLSNTEKQITAKRDQDLSQALEEIRQEIKKLVSSTNDLDKEIENVVLENIPEVSEYQINFLTRIKNFILNFRQNIDEAQNWLATFNTKKKKRNYYWSTARNKKQGGEQYLTSSEHSASRSVN
ncbi:hypothetical protein KBB92_01615 [Candidatus Shapirobacteria bacterium]|nr:hypothetical protein [Candidatus Shapirobacteria bacterium]